MAQPIQSTFSFPGLDTFTNVDFVFNRGILPSVCLVEFPYVPSSPTQIGSMVFTFGNDKLTFTNCAFNRAHVRKVLRKGSPVWVCQIQDRRWKWQCGEINGDYNRRLPDGSVIADDKKNPQELATLLLQAMGEQGFDVSVLPTTAWPRASWKAANPAAKLDELCRSFGCVVVLGFDDKVRICVTGIGASLDDAANLRFTMYPTIPTRNPAGVEVVASETVWQMTFECEAIGCEEDGSTKLLDDLSYTPAAPGWSGEWWCAYRSVSEASRSLAFNYVYRWYRIKGLLGGGWQFPNCPVQVNGLSQLVFEDGILGAPIGLDGEPVLLKEILSGEFWTQGDFPVNSQPFTRYAGGFKFRGDIGTVITDYPALFFETSAGAPGQVQQFPAKLFITAACKIRNPNGDGFVHHFKQNQFSANGGGFAILRHPELRRTIIQSYDSSGNPGAVTDTQFAVESEMSAYLLAISQYVPLSRKDGEFIGLWTTPLDGSLAQVQFKLGVRHGMKSRVGQNMEFDVFSRDIAQRYRLEQTDVLTGVV